MIRVTEHTRRSPARVICNVCNWRIEPGSRYRQLVAVQSEAFEHGFVRVAAHSACTLNRELWSITTPGSIRAAAEASLSYVRERYGDRFPLGARCTAAGKPGKIAGGDGGYVLVVLDGERRAGSYHPGGVEVTP